MDSEHRLARLRADIAAGNYAPPAEAVAESLVGWIARPEQFERPPAGRTETGAGRERRTVRGGHDGRDRGAGSQRCRRSDGRRPRRQKLAKFERLAPDIRRIEVEFSEVKNPRVADSQECEVTVHLTKNLVKAHAAAPDARTALDRVLDKVSHQLTRVHDKRVHRSKPRHPAAPEAPPEPVD